MRTPEPIPETMQYMILIYSDESTYGRMNEAEMGELMAQYGAFHEEIAASGKMLGANRLCPTQTATTVRMRKGQAATTDGPFAETKEQLGGYYLIEASDLDEALAWANKVPTVTYGSIEVRPVWLDDAEGQQ